MNRLRRLPLIGGLIIVAVAAFIAALASGSAAIGLGEVAEVLRGNAPENTTSLVLELRLPRALTALAVGGLLAIAGVLTVAR